MSNPSDSIQAVTPQSAHDFLREIDDKMDLMGMGINFFEENIDDVVFETNQFMCNPTFLGMGGPFWYILQICLILSSIFCLILCANMGYKMMVKHEPMDVLKLFKPLAIALVLGYWYPADLHNSNDNNSVLDILAVIPNAIGSYTHDLYEVEAVNVQNTYSAVNRLMAHRDSLYNIKEGENMMANDYLNKNQVDTGGATSVGSNLDIAKGAAENFTQSTIAGIIILFDKIVMFVALVIYRIAWWGVIFSQQILLGVLTFFGPIHWAMSLLPKWENAWVKWISRYLTVHFYGAMLYFTGFYVLLLFDIVLSIQYEDLLLITGSEADFTAYLKNTFFTTGYLMAASCVSLKCVAMVPDLAAWIVPEGEISMSARSFGDGIGGEMKNQMKSIMGGHLGGAI